MSGVIVGTPIAYQEIRHTSPSDGEVICPRCEAVIHVKDSEHVGALSDECNRLHALLDERTRDRDRIAESFRMVSVSLQHASEDCVLYCRQRDEFMGELDELERECIRLRKQLRAKTTTQCAKSKRRYPEPLPEYLL